ncbi:MAG TPA: response regulator [Chloroflexota bacterium]|jgi:CheY-like chemotaxis protein
MTPPGAPARPTILVVEDEPPVQQLVADLLADEGYRVLLAADGAEALALVGAEPPDLVLTDLMMPVLNGVELCRRLRADERTRAVPIVVMTAAGRGPSETAGANAYLAKPFDLDVLLEVIASYVGPGQT